MAIGSSALPRSVERSAASSSPTLISRTSSKPLVMTSMLEVTTPSPSLPNFFTYCLWTASRNCSGVMRKSCSIGDTEKNAPRNALPCMRSCRSPRSVASRAILKPGSVKTRMFLSMISFRAHSGSRSHAASPSSSDSQTRRSALGHAVERVGVGKGLGIAAEDDVDVTEIAVDPNPFRGGDHEVRGRRPLLL